MQTFEHTSLLPITADKLYEWHTHPGALQRLSPPWEAMEVIEHGGISDGARMVARIGPGPIKPTWIAHHYDNIPGRQFVDKQVKGPFNHWTHTHLFIPADNDHCTMRDQVNYKLPLGTLGQLVAGSYIKNRLQRMFHFRHTRLMQDITLHQKYAHHKRLTIAITGSSGLLGTALTALLTTGGHTVRPLVRRPVLPNTNEIFWKPSTQTLNPADLENIDALIHLAGAGIADKRWSPQRKRLILDSRVNGTQLLAKTLQQLDKPPKVFLSSSAVGYYGDRQSPIDESSPPGEGFMAEVCQAWEHALQPLTRPDIRVVRMRTGVVLTPRGGALKELLLPSKLGLGGPLGAGTQGFSWISADDLIRIFYSALFEDSWSGPINLVAPQTLSQHDFAKALGHVLHRPSFLPLPAFAVRTIFGEMGQKILLEGAPVQPTFLTQHNYPFLHPTIDTALRHLLGL